MSVWGGHSCPPPLRLILTFRIAEVVGYVARQRQAQSLNEERWVQSNGNINRNGNRNGNRNSNSNGNRNGGGQECPPHTLIPLPRDHC